MDLTKLFVSVPTDKVDTFIGKYVTPKDGASRDEKYDQKIVFLGSTGQIFTQGQLYGAAAADVTELKNILVGFNTEDADEAKRTVANAIAAAKDAVIGSYDGKDGKSNDTISSLDQRLEAIETLISVDSSDADNNVIDKLQEVLDWFNNVSEASQEVTVTATDGTPVKLGTGAIALQQIADNTVAIGKKGVQEQYYTAEEAAALNAEHAGEEGWVDVTEETVKTPAVEATGLYKEIEVAVADAVADANSAIDELDSTVYSDGSDAEGYAGSTELVKAKVAQENGKLTSIDVAVKTTELKDAVGLTRGEDGKWTATDNTTGLSDGLATAGDVAAEIVADELVIANALNDHEARVAAIEGADTSKAATVTYTAGTGFDEASLSVDDSDAEGNVLTAAALPAIKNYVDALHTEVKSWEMWETYTEEVTTPETPAEDETTPTEDENA